MFKPKYKVLMIGLDGATFDVMLPWIDQGYLPCLGKLVRGGAWSRLNSTIPPLTPCAWSSFLTGKNPGKHGLFDFSQPVPNSYKLRFNNASFRSGTSLWKYLSQLNQRVGVLNVPMTFPPEEVNGYLISGMDTPHERNQFMYPATLRQELKDAAIDYRLDLRHLGNMRTDARRDLGLQELKEIESLRTKALQYLRQKYPSDFTMLVYTASDQVQHHFWHYMDPTHDKFDAKGADRYRNAIRDVYVHLDKLIASVLENKEDDTVVMLMSDHGFGPTTNIRLRINQALEKAGLLTFAKEGGSNRAFRRVIDFMSRGLRSFLSHQAKTYLAGAFPRFRVWFETTGGAGIDWSKTIAFTNEAFRPPSIWINRKDRFPQGTVAPDDLEGALKKTQDVLLALRDPKTGKPVVSHVYRTRDLYHGPLAPHSPDLIPSWWEDGFLQETSVPGGPADQVVERSQTPIKGGVEFAGNHRLDGIFSMAGGPARSGCELSGAEIIDVAPTVLYLMGLPIPGDMDGRPLVEGLDPAFVAARPPEVDHHPNGAAMQPTPPNTETVFSQDEEDMISKRLQALGYIE